MASEFALTWWTQISNSQKLRVGRLLKAHGLKGAIKLELYTDSPNERFVPGSEFELQVPESSPWFGKSVKVKELRWYNQAPVVFLEGVEDRTGAESLIKAILLVDQDIEVEPTDDAWYDLQLVGLKVIRDDKEIGKVVRVDHLPAQDILAIQTAEQEVLLPFAKALVPEVNVKDGFIRITPPGGLFEVIEEENED
ncbi:MAG: ribosome maturation factor RimM [Actinomycetota bacterium]